MRRRNTNEQLKCHAHSFEGVIQALLDDPEGFSIEGLEEYYSAQEREMELCYPELKNDNGRI